MMGTPLWKKGAGPARQNGVQARVGWKDTAKRVTYSGINKNIFL
jgi:hypothetical protein